MRKIKKKITKLCAQKTHNGIRKQKLFRMPAKCSNSTREFRIEGHHSHRAILNLEQVAPIVAGGGGAPPPEQLTNSQNSHYSSNNASSSSATQNTVK